MEETANSLEAGIVAARRALDYQQQRLTNKEAALGAINDKLGAIKRELATGPIVGARKKKKDVKSLEGQISEREGTIAKERQDIADKQQVLEELNDRLAAIKLKEATQARLSHFPHKKFRHGGHQGITELDKTLKTKEAYLKSLKGQLEELELENALEVIKVNDASQENVCQATTARLSQFPHKKFRHGRHQGIAELDRSLKTKETVLQPLQGEELGLGNGPADFSQDNDQLQENVFKQDPVELAFSTLEIWEKIFGKLDNRSQKAARLVSQSWNKRALKIFCDNGVIWGENPTHLLFRLHNLYKTSKSGSESDPLTPAFDPKLATYILFHDYRGRQCYDFSRYKCLTICSQFSQQMQIMDLHLTKAMISTLFNEMINRGSFPTLKSFTLSLINSTDFLQEERADGDSEESLAPRTNLHNIDIDLSADNSPKAFQSRLQLQLIIDTALNLKTLAINANFAPDLRHNSKLEELRFTHHNWQDFDLRQFSELLAQVQDSLQILEMKTSESSRADVLFRYPVMKTLKKLTITNIILRPLGQDGSSFIANIVENFPALQYLFINNNENEEEDGIQSLFNSGLRDLESSHLKLASLCLTNVGDPSILRHFHAWFPNLRKLDLCSSGGLREEAICAELSALKGLQLKELRLGIKYPFKLSQMVKALVVNKELFSGMDKFVMTDDGKSAEDDLNTEVLALDDRNYFRLSLQLFCGWLESTTKEMRFVDFRNFTFSEASAEKLGAVIAAKKLPVKLIGSFLPIRVGSAY